MNTNQILGMKQIKCMECGGNHEPSGARSDCIRHWKQIALKSENGPGRKIIQIAIAGTVENSMTQSEALILALADDGTLWSRTNRLSGWEQWIGLPVTDETPKI